MSSSSSNRRVARIYSRLGHESGIVSNDLVPDHVFRENVNEMIDKEEVVMK